MVAATFNSCLDLLPINVNIVHDISHLQVAHASDMHKAHAQKILHIISSLDLL